MVLPVAPPTQRTAAIRETKERLCSYGLIENEIETECGLAVQPHETGAKWKMSAESVGEWTSPMADRAIASLQPLGEPLAEQAPARPKREQVPPLDNRRYTNRRETSRWRVHVRRARKPPARHHQD